jgi:glycosyltransferase involved in cell wall biosynthesis
MSDEQRTKWCAYPGVVAKGYVENLETVYREAAFSVVPIFEGGGTKIKVLESLAYGRTCVVAEHSVRGHEHVLKDGDSISVAKDEAELAAHCIRLLSHPRACAQMAERGADVVAKSFSFDSFSRRVATDVEKVMHDRRSRASTAAA